MTNPLKLSDCWYWVPITTGFGGCSTNRKQYACVVEEMAATVYQSGRGDEGGEDLVCGWEGGEGSGGG